MNLQEMLGDSFHEGMTIDEINTALSGRKFADLSTGQYVDKNKYNADIQAKDDALKKANEALNAKTANEAKFNSANDSNLAKIQELETIIKNQTISANRDKVQNLTTDVKTILGIKDDDESYISLLDTLSKGEADETRTLASYINKLVKDSYEKGKNDATKDNLGNFSNGVGKQGSGAKDPIGDFGKTLAANNKSSIDPNLYFREK